jgi:curli biogenesis system outer membrane secretion channel CsgG
VKNKKYYRKAVLASVVSSMILSGCATQGPVMNVATENVGLVKGPPIQDITTPYDSALSCLRGRVSKKVTFAVGAILDQTGKEQITEGGTGKFVTQGAGDLVQSALFKAGVTVLNRRDPRILETEVKWGLQDSKGIVPTDYFITGSINSLDVLPGGGVQAEVGGIGPTYSQMRILVGLDMSLTNARTGQVVANVPLQKQIFASDFEFAIGRFMGKNLVNFNAGYKEREAIHFALRQMLSLATFDLLSQVMKPQNYADCQGLIDKMNDGGVENSGTAKKVMAFKADIAKAKAAGEKVAEPPVPKDGDKINPQDADLPKQRGSGVEDKSLIGRKSLGDSNTESQPSLTDKKAVIIQGR